MNFIVLMVLVLFAARASAFPEMVRHGYTQCTACHVSPSGGGILNAYGRQLSAELLSTWKFAGEGGVLHGALKNDPAEKGLLLGGDVRAVQVHQQTPNVRTGRFFLMQANVDAAYQKGPFTAMISVGQIEKPMSGVVQGNLNATRYYAQVNITDPWFVRAGRFVPVFGLNMPDHVLVTKNGTGFAPGLQMDTVETGYLSESWTFFAAAARTLPTVPAARAETARNFHAAYSLAERYKVGVSHWYGERPSGGVRRLYGVSAILGFSEHLYNLTEINWSTTASRDGLFAMTRLGWEVVQGVIPYVQLQQEQSDLEDRSKRVRYYTAGMHFFPRPHFELNAQWSRARSAAEWSDQAYFLVHYYF